MRAVQYFRSVPRYFLQKLLSSASPRVNLSCAPVRLAEVPEPALPGPRWLRLRPRLTGICGSDLATITGKGSPYLAPVTSLPFVLGHEVVATVTDTGPEVTRVRAGDRVVLQPALGCQVRGIEPLCPACAEGRAALCRNVNQGALSAGIQTGYCRDTGGAWSEGFVAQESQVYPVPPELPDAAAVLVEPFACALHGALQVRLQAGQTALVIGCGTIGLLVIAALRARDCRARVVAVARFDHQAEHARRLGADAVVPAFGPVLSRYRDWASALGADVLKPELGKPAVLGGADVVFDCIASSQTIDDALRFTRGGGTVVLVGMPGVPAGVDWTPLWFKELTIKASYAYGVETLPDGTCDTFTLALRLMTSSGDQLKPLVSDPYPLAEYRQAVLAALTRGDGRSVKTVLTVPS
ncbi:MAG TPA: zinc-binding dehydrogenase [Phycisphaerae bacterium]|nr:zinc-binding dehydrogenase [Phycisphaerae bacterium]HNU47047.1 zinc-binding dehydrogenase [Phycisphaerae bacterium]